MKINFFLIATLLLSDISKAQFCANDSCNQYKKKAAINAMLANKPIPNYYAGYLSIRCNNINDSIKKRLFYLLEPTWTQAEIEQYKRYVIATHVSFTKHIPAEALKLSKGNDSLYRVIYDSLIKKNWLYIFQYRVQNGLFNVPNSILYSVAMLYMYEAVPIIRKNIQHYNRNVAELCLARLGDTALQAKILRENVYTTEVISGIKWIEDFYKQFSKYAFIRSQEGMYQTHNMLDTTVNISRVSAAFDSGAYEVVRSLKCVIQNPDFQELIKNKTEYECDNCSFSGTLIMQVKEWLINNRGKYQITTEFSPPVNLY